jgi:TetR/AcrR family transcriptional regulator
MCARPAEKIRDAQRSREAILEAAERRFSTWGYEGAGLNDIAADAGLSRGTPSYFFGSKERLYVEVLDRASTARQAATEAAFEPVHQWCTGDDDSLGALRAALVTTAERYMQCLADRPSFVELVMREELAGGRSTPPRTTSSTAMLDAFGAIRRVARRRGLRPFEVDDAILVFVTLTFAPMSLRSTLMASLGRDLGSRAGRRRQIELAVEQLMHLLTG